MKFLALAVAVLLSVTLGGCRTSTETPEKAAAAASAERVKVRAEPARRQTVLETVDGLGKCEALLERLVTLTPAVEGRVERLLARPGQSVRAGQVLIQLDPAMARADVDEKIATRDGLKAALELLKSLPRPPERRAQELAVEQAKLAVDKAQVQLDRLRPLYDRHEIAGIQWLEAQGTLSQARLQEQSARAQLAAMMLGPRPQAVAEAQAKIVTADATLALSQARLALHAIRAPIDGVLDSLSCHPGQTIAAGTPIGQVIDRHVVYAAIWLPASSAQAVRAGQEARVSPADSPRPAASAAPAVTRVIHGKVQSVGEMLDPQTGNRPARVLVDNPDQALTIGQTVEVSITIDRRAGVLTVPAAAVFESGQGRVVNVVRGGKLVVLRPQSIRTYADGVEIGGTDLHEGEPVVTEGAFNLPEGTEVTVETARGAATAKESP
jgi:RND family efflux transporter MFP subunit